MTFYLVHVLVGCCKDVVFRRSVYALCQFKMAMTLLRKGHGVNKDEDHKSQIEEVGDGKGEMLYLFVYHKNRRQPILK